MTHLRMLRSHRERAGLSQRALARATGCIDQAELSKAENGLTYISRQRAQRIADVLGIAVDDLS